MVKKTTICVSVDIDTLMAAKTKVDNISRYVNECLINLTGKSLEDLKEEELKIELNRLKELAQDTAIRQSFIEQAIKNIQDEKLKEQAKIKELEQYKRWKCGACNQLNFMEQDRCSKCTLPTRKDSKTTIVNIKGE